MYAKSCCPDYPLYIRYQDDIYDSLSHTCHQYVFYDVVTKLCSVSIAQSLRLVLMNRPGTDVSNRCFEQQNFPLSSCTHLTVILALVTSRHIASTCPQKYERPLELSVLMAPFPAFRYNTSWSGELVTHNLHRARTNTCTQTALSACTFYSLCFVFATMKISTNSHWVSRDWWQSRRNSWCPSCTNRLPAHPPDVNVMWVVLNGGEIDVAKLCIQGKANLEYWSSREWHYSHQENQNGKAG